MEAGARGLPDLRHLHHLLEDEECPRTAHNIRVASLDVVCKNRRLGSQACITSITFITSFIEAR